MPRGSGLKQKFTHLLPRPDGGVADARAYMLPLSKESKLQSSSILSSECRFQRPKVAGKFLCVGQQKFWVRGVTYGAFRPDARGDEYHDLKIIRRDFAQMAANGLNTVRIPHTMPPRSLLDAAHEHGLRVMVGLSAEQYVGFLIDKKRAPDIEHCVRTSARA